jgi:hypothetical protein
MGAVIVIFSRGPKDTISALQERLTRRNAGGSYMPKNPIAEAGLLGWGERTRTQESVRKLCI